MGNNKNETNKCVCVIFFFLHIFPIGSSILNRHFIAVEILTYQYWKQLIRHFKSRNVIINFRFDVKHAVKLFISNNAVSLNCSHFYAFHFMGQTTLSWSNVSLYTPKQLRKITFTSANDKQNRRILEIKTHIAHPCSFLYCVHI